MAKLNSGTRIYGNATIDSNLIVGGNVIAQYLFGNGSALSGIVTSAFGNIFIAGQSPVLADNTSDTLTLVSGSGIAITANASLDTITIATVSTEGPFATSGDFGAVNEAVTVSEDEGSVADGASITYDLGSIISATGLIYPDQLVLPNYSTASLPSATVAGQLVYDTTTQSLAYTNGTIWNSLVGGYSNVQVATYLPTYTGTVGAGLINSSGNILATGLSVFGNTRIGSLATPDALHTIIGNVDVSGAGTEYFNIGGNILAVQGSFGSINSTGFINTSGNVSAAIGSFDSITVRAAVTAIANGGTSGVGNIGATGATFNTVFAKATTAQYADLAENYSADAEYAPGTVLEFGGEAEVTLAEHNTVRVAGIVSTKPAYLMNSLLDGEKTVTLALLGRVPCKVTGSIAKGDMLISAGNGRACAEATPKLGSIIGKALENFNGLEGVIEVVVGRI